jgi:hypothetical protein
VINFNKFLRGKIGGDKVISIYWFAIIVIVAGGVFAMAYNFYGAPYDVREIEVDVFSNKVSDCISFKGVLNKNLFNISTGDFDSSFEENFYEYCGLSFETEKEYLWENTNQYFTEVIFYDINGEELFKFFKGNINLKQDCFVKDKKGNEYDILSKCSEKRFYSVSPLNEDDQYLVSVLSGIRKSEKNVKI